jgi:hypothetical protein
MKNHIHKSFSIKYPRSFLIENPLAGAVIVAVFCFAFLTLYQPLNAHASKSLSYAATMAVYSLASGLSVLLSVKILSFSRWFRNVKEWTLLKEMISVFIIIFGIGTVIYLLGFVVEPAGERLNLPTFLNSLKSAFLLAIIPFAFFSSVNYQFLLNPVNDNNIKNARIQDIAEHKAEEIIRIGSQLKKEEIRFYPSQFIYAESDGNYVVFYLSRENGIKKEIIRNSISNIEKQLSNTPWFFRTHRAFIVNLKKVKSRQGNILGYQLRLTETDFVIPVSRSNIRNFDLVFSEISLS